MAKSRSSSPCNGAIAIACPGGEKPNERRRIKAHFVLLVLIQFTVILGIFEQLLENTDFYRERFYQRLARDRIHHVRPEENTYKKFHFVAHKRPPEEIWAERGIIQFADFARTVSSNNSLYPPLKIRPGTTNGESLSTLTFDIKPEREGVYEHFLKHCLAMTMHRKTAEMAPYCPCFSQRQEYTISPRLRLPSRSEITAVEKSVELGGRWRPRGCTSRQRVAILIPYRDRQSHLKVFLNHIHPFMQRQNIEYQIFVVEQAWPAVFNKASIMNAGYIEAKTRGQFDCYIFHDVDLVPEHDHHLYNCLLEPRHLAVYIDKFNYSLHYESIFGGAIALTQEQFERVNGFSNLYYGWGGEDDDMFRRVLSAGYNILRFPDWMARYAMIKHARDKGNPTNNDAFNGTRWRTGDSYDADGLSSLKYYVITNDTLPLYTWIYIGVPDPPATWKEFRSTEPPFIPTIPPVPAEPPANPPAEPAADPVLPAAVPAEPAGVAVEVPVQIDQGVNVGGPEPVPPEPVQAGVQAVQQEIPVGADSAVQPAAVQNIIPQFVDIGAGPAPIQPNPAVMAAAAAMNPQLVDQAAAGLFQMQPDLAGAGGPAMAMGDTLGGMGLGGIDPFDAQMELLINLWKASKARHAVNRYPWQRNQNFESASKLWEEKMKHVPQNQQQFGAQAGLLQQMAAMQQQQQPFAAPQQPAAAQPAAVQQPFVAQQQFQQQQQQQQQPVVAQQPAAVQQQPVVAQQPAAVQVPAAVAAAAQQPPAAAAAVAQDPVAVLQPAAQEPAAVAAVPDKPAAAPADNPFGPPPPVVL